MRHAYQRFAAVLLIAVATLAAARSSGPARADDDVLLGMSTALSGPAADLGRNMRDGVLAALDEANRAGGLRGRHMRLVVLDDGYEPAKTVPNMRTVVSDPRVMAVVGNVGTPTAVAAIPVAVEAKVPFYGAFTGAGALRKLPPERYVINYRASYAEETAAMVDALVEKAGLRPEEIAFFTQRDAFGDAGFAGGIAAMVRHGLVEEGVVRHVRYERNSTAVHKAVADLLLARTPPRAVIMVGTYAPSAAFIKLAQENGLEALLLNVSFVGAESLARALGPIGDGVIVTQTVPHYDAEQPIAREYRRALTTLDANLGPTFGSMEGYVSARLLLEALRRGQGPVTREGVVDALESLGSVDLGSGAPLRLSATEHQASHTIWPTVLRGGRVVPLKWDDLADMNAGHE